LCLPLTRIDDLAFDSQAHFPCTEKECLEKKFVVFGSEIDWRAHMMAEVSRGNPLRVPQRHD